MSKVGVTMHSIALFPGVFVYSGYQNEMSQNGCLNNRNLFSHSSRGWQSKLKVPAELDSSETSLLSL